MTSINLWSLVWLSLVVHMTSINLWSLAWLLVTVQSAFVGASSLIEGHRAFADSLTADLYADDNECTSAWGISMAFSLVYPGSSGLAETQIQEILGYPPDETKLQLLWNDTSVELSTKYDGNCTYEYEGICERKNPMLKIANSVWIDTDVVLNDTYQQVVGDYVLTTDFEDDGAGDVVNEWVNLSTNGLIDSIVEEGPLFPPVVMLAINSIYLNASWMNSFLEEHTSEDVFYTETSRQVEVEDKAHFMHQVEEFRYSHTALPGFQIVELPFLESSMSMLIVLPMQSNATTTTSSASVLEALPSLEKTRVALALPKFQFESMYKDNLKESLVNLGMTAPFEDDAFCDMFEGFCGSIDYVVQKTYINVHEKGTEAAAVTAIAIRPTSGIPPGDPMLFMADHPFSFFIYDQMQDLVIFEGRVGNPGVPEDAPEATLQTRHSNETFWSETFRVNPIDPSPQIAPKNKTTQPDTTQPDMETSSSIQQTQGAWTILMLAMLVMVLR